MNEGTTFSTDFITAIQMGFYQTVRQHTWESLLEWLYAWSHTLWQVQWQGPQTLLETGESEGRQHKSLSHSLTSCKAKGPDYGLVKNLLHSCIRCTADVAGDDHQAVRRQTGHHSGQVELKPQLIVFWLKVPKFRSKACQGQVQDGVSDSWIEDVGDVFLEMKGLVSQIQKTFDLP